MEKTVCLIIPPSGFLLDDRVFMHLGILKVAAVLEQKGVLVDVLDLSGVDNYLQVIDDYISVKDTYIFGITATTPQLPPAIAIAKTIRELKKDARLILGGPHITLVCAANKKNPEGRSIKALKTLKEIFDVLIAGDGEIAIFEALKNETSKIIDADNPRNQSKLFLTNRQLEELPYPARHLVDVDSYHYMIDGERALSLIAQLGCPFNCGFCGGRSSPMLHHVRTRCPESIVQEMVFLYKTYGIKAFMFYDDELNVTNKIFVRLMRLITGKQRELGTEWKLRGFIKSELFTDEQAEAMHDAGFRWILTGFESGSPRMLLNMNKRATLEDNTRCVEIARRHGLKVKALMSIGHPGESLETIRQTTNWLLEVKPDDFDVSVITVYPGCPYYDEAVSCEDEVWIYVCKSGDNLYQQELDYTKTADYYKGDPNGGYKAYVWTDFLSSEALILGRNRIEMTVREKLEIPFYTSTPAIQYEYSMGQSGQLPQTILKTSHIVNS